jgi:hypothetical protein
MIGLLRQTLIAVSCPLDANRLLAVLLHRWRQYRWVFRIRSISRIALATGFPAFRGDGGNRG